MSASINLSPGQPGGAASPSSQPTLSPAPSGPIHAAGAHSVNPQPPTPPVPANAFQKAVQKYVGELSHDDKAAFLDSPDVMQRLQEMQYDDKSSSRLARAEKVLQCVKYFMGSLGIFIQHSPEISSLVVGGVNCILTVGTSSTYSLPSYYSYAKLI